MKSKKVVQFFGNEVAIEELEKKIKNIWRQEGKLQKDLKSLEIYVKVEENKCYYVINDNITGKFDLTA